MMLNCREAGRMASEYLDGGLSWWGRLELRLHVAMCRHCRRYLVQLRLVTRTLRQLSERSTGAREGQESTIRVFLRGRFGR
jgi:anti-sigma factor ChrR (cupin superfamily)